MTRFAPVCLIASIALLVPASAEASRAPTKAEAKAIKKGFLKGRRRA